VSEQNKKLFFWRRGDREKKRINSHWLITSDGKEKIGSSHTAPRIESSHQGRVSEPRCITKQCGTWGVAPSAGKKGADRPGKINEQSA